MNEILTMLENSEAAREMCDLWHEYELGTSTEAMIVKDMDKLEMIVQACEYEKTDRKNLQSFFDSTKDIFRHPFSQSIAEAVYTERSTSKF